MLVKVLQFCPQCKNVFPSKTLPKKDIRKFVIKEDVETWIITELCKTCAKIVQAQEF